MVGRLPLKEDILGSNPSSATERDSPPIFGVVARAPAHQNLKGRDLATCKLQSSAE